MSETPPDLWRRVQAGERRALARAATLLENGGPLGEALLRELYPCTGRALTIGVTGPPGAGKSTLLDQLARQLRRQGQSVGILAVDPSSPLRGGAILGDRVRMQQHAGDPGVFIRSLATRGALGGLARATLDLALLLDASGRDAVLIETVGVGQDEVDIAQVAEVTVVVLTPGMGDDVQTMKAGVLEIASVFVINKADQPGCDRLEQELRAMLQLDTPPRDVPLLRTIATTGQGVAELLSAVHSVREASGAKRLAQQRQRWQALLLQMVRDRVQALISPQALEEAAAAVAARRMDPPGAVEELARRAVTRMATEKVPDPSGN